MAEWKKLGDVSHYYRGVTYNKKQEVSLNSGGTKIFRANNIDIGTNSLNYDDIKEISKDVKIKDNQWLYKDDILICAGSGSKEHVGKVAYIKENLNYAYGGFMGKIVTDESLSSRYLFHVISGLLFKKYLEVALNSTTINNLNSEIVNKFEIPVPSLSEQTRIVGILDTFTASIENLKQQIAERRKQYEHYRDQLLDLEGKEGVEMKKLEEACEIRRGIRVVKKQLKDNALYPVFQNSIAPMGYYDQFNRDGNMPYIICAGSSSGSVGYCCTPFWAADDCFTIESSKVNRRYTYYALKKNNNNLFKLVRKGSMPRLPHEAIDNMVIPIPSIQEQQRIVSILNTFEASIANLEEQLKEREKQYEYYRNKLLTFE